MLVNDTNLPKVIIVQGEKKKERQKKRDPKKKKNTPINEKRAFGCSMLFCAFPTYQKTSPLCAAGFFKGIFLCSLNGDHPKEDLYKNGDRP
jgi:hypothetical protein